MMMIVMEVEMMIEMVMGGRGNGALEMMTVMVSMGVMEIGTAEIRMNATAEMVTEMMIPGDEVEALMTTGMVREVGAVTERENVLMKMMVNIHLEEAAPELMIVLKMEALQESSLTGNFLNRILVLLLVMKMLWVRLVALFSVKGMGKLQHLLPNHLQL
jgi:hypothetical protein